MTINIDHTGNKVAAAGAAADIDLDLIAKGTGLVKSNGTALLLSGGALGTPSSGTLTNCSGLPLATGVSGTLPKANATVGSVIQVVQSMTITGGGVFGNLTSVGVASPSTLFTVAVNNVLANSIIVGYFYTSAMVANNTQTIFSLVSGGGIGTTFKTLFNTVSSGNVNGDGLVAFVDTAPTTGTNTYTLEAYSNASGNAAYWCSNGGYTYGYVIMEIQQ